jgi:RNA polymerase sigma factor (sigma-70 family)
MAKQLHRFLHCLRQAALRTGGLSDGQLLQLYRDTGDEVAFAAMVRRHGPMVLGVCRRVLGHFQDAEDAFQATFLVLVRKAATIVPPEAVGPWLHGVAYRAAQKARQAAARRRARERLARPRPAQEFPDRDDRCDDLDREIARLPEVYRNAVVLCELQGLSRKEAARRLGCPEGTLSSRLAKARRLLAQRLRGPTVVAAALTAAGQAAQAAVPPELVRAAEAAARGLVSTEVMTLAQGVMHAMLLSRARWVAVLLLVASTLAAGLALAPGSRAEPRPDAGDETKVAGPAEAVAVRRLEGHTDGVMAVAFSPDGKRVLSGGACYGDGDPTVRLWDVATGKELLCLTGHTLGVYGVAFLPDGNLAASGSLDKTVRLWRLPR